MDKSQQTTDWEKRPLTRRQIAYAVTDSFVILQVFNVQRKLLEKGEGWKEAEINETVSSFFDKETSKKEEWKTG